MGNKVYKKENIFYVDPQHTKRYYGPIKINNNLEWIGRDGTSTYMRSIEYTPSEEAIKKLKEYEGWHEGWQDDGKGNLTTGWGFKITPELKKQYPNGMSRQQADEYLVNVAIPERVDALLRSVPNADRYNQNQLDALFSYIYNIGEGAFTKKSPKLQEALLNRDIQGIVDNMDYGYNQKNLSGLRKRRNWERQLFLTPMQRPASYHIGGKIKLIPRTIKYN